MPPLNREQRESGGTRTVLSETAVCDRNVIRTPENLDEYRSLRTLTERSGLELSRGGIARYGVSELLGVDGPCRFPSVLDRPLRHLSV